jgi:dihydroorotate dehydrogenase
VSSNALYSRWIRPLLFAMDAEKVHHLAMDLLAAAGPLLRRFAPAADSTLEREVFGLRFPNPIGLAAGFDKNAVALPAWEGLGFGFAEVGTITAKAQPGNPSPRIFRLPKQQALINRLGFNNEGCDAVAARLRKLKERGGWPGIPVGINLGKSKTTPLDEATADYLLSFERLRHFGDYFVLNVSSPNTPGLRQLQDREALDGLLDSFQARNVDGRPVLIKIAPDLDWPAIDEIISLALEHRAAGLIATNTTVDHSSVPSAVDTAGGLSGRPVRERSTEIVRYITQHTALPVIAVGGVFTADDVVEKIDAGASLVQVYTGLVYEGPLMPRRLCAELIARGGL